MEPIKHYTFTCSVTILLNGINICCDIGRKPGVCCKNSSEILTREAPFSSITAGPSSSTAAPSLDDDDDDDDEDGPTSTTRNTFTLTLRRTVTSSPSTLPTTLAQTIVVQTTGAAHSPVTEAAHHSNLGAGLGGGLGGAAAVLVGIAIFFYSRRKKKRVSKDKGSDYHELDHPDPTHRHNSTLFPAELNCEDSKVPPVPAELGSKTTIMPVGPYELQGDTEVIHQGATSGNHHDSLLSEISAIPPAYSRDIKTTKAKDNAQDNPRSKHTTIDSDLSDIKGTAALAHRPSAQVRPESTSSRSGPWHDTYQ
ncbi:MAG: hypothetical protein Q9182_005406 [Xanthomendoza sp. 2 TL-2023]